MILRNRFGRHSSVGGNPFRSSNFIFPDPDRNFGGKLRNVLGPLFGNWVFSHFEKAIAACR